MADVGDEYGIYYQPDLAARRVSANVIALLWRIGSLMFSMLIVALAWLLWPAQLQDWAPWFLAVTAVTNGLMVVLSLIRYLRSRKDAAIAKPGGLAIGLNRAGMLIDQRWFAWPEVGSMTIKPEMLGSAAQLVTRVGDEAIQIPLGMTDTLPASLDSAVKVLSTGQLTVDLTRFE